VTFDFALKYISEASVLDCKSLDSEEFSKFKKGNNSVKIHVKLIGLG
jgi:hypothetical protein